MSSQAFGDSIAVRPNTFDPHSLMKHSYLSSSKKLLEAIMRTRALTSVIDPLGVDYTVRFGWRFHVPQTVCRRGMRQACPPMSHASASNGLSDIKTHRVMADK
jgi:hypothetical protein